MVRERDDLKTGGVKDCTNLELQIKMSKTSLMQYPQILKKLEIYAFCVDLTNSLSKVTA